MGVAAGSWDILDTRFRCPALPPEIREEASVLLRPFASGESEPARTFRIEIDPTEPAVVLLNGGTDDRLVLDSLTGRDVEYALIARAVHETRDRIVLHGAAVVTDGGTCVITGGSGAGKTTLAMYLWSRGMPLVGDDLLPISLDSRSPQLFPRAIHLDGPDTLGLRRQVPPTRHYPSDYYPFPDAGDLSVPPVTTLVELRKEGPENGELVKTTHSEAVHSLLRATIRTRHFSFSRSLRKLSQIASSCRSYRLHASTARGAASTTWTLLAG